MPNQSLERMVRPLLLFQITIPGAQFFVIQLEDNMAGLKSLNELLSAAAEILNTAATEIRDIPLDPSNENIRKIGQALSSIFDIQHQIYKIEPELEPEYLKKQSPFPKGVNKRFGEILLKASDLCDEKRYQEAISLYESYISEKPPDFFIRLARDRINEIKQNYNV